MRVSTQKVPATPAQEMRVKSQLATRRQGQLCENHGMKEKFIAGEKRINTRLILLLTRDREFENLLTEKTPSIQLIKVSNNIYLMTSWFIVMNFSF